MIWEIVSLSKLQKMLQFTARDVCCREKTVGVAVHLASTLEV